MSPDSSVYIDSSRAALIDGGVQIVSNLTAIRPTKTSILYHGVHSKTGKPAIVKTLNPNHNDLIYGREVYQAEMQAYQELAPYHHANIAEYLIGYTTEYPIIVTEFVGPSLMEVLRQINIYNLPKFNRTGEYNIYSQLVNIFKIFELVGGHRNLTPNNLVVAHPNGTPINKIEEVKQIQNEFRLKAIDPGNMVGGLIMPSPNYTHNDWADIVLIMEQIKDQGYIQ